MPAHHCPPHLLKASITARLFAHHAQASVSDIIRALEIWSRFVSSPYLEDFVLFPALCEIWKMKSASILKGSCDGILCLHCHLICRIECKKWPLTQWFLRSVKEEASEVRWGCYYFELFIKNLVPSKTQDYFSCIWACPHQLTNWRTMHLDDGPYSDRFIQEETVPRRLLQRFPRILLPLNLMGTKQENMFYNNLIICVSNIFSKDNSFCSCPRPCHFSQSVLLGLISDILLQILFFMAQLFS